MFYDRGKWPNHILEVCQLNGAISFWRKSSLAAKGSDLSLLQFLYQDCIILPAPSLSKKAYLQTFTIWPPSQLHIQQLHQR